MNKIRLIIFFLVVFLLYNMLFFSIMLYVGSSDIEVVYGGHEDGGVVYHVMSRVCDVMMMGDTMIFIREYIGIDSSVNWFEWVLLFIINFIYSLFIFFVVIVVRNMRRGEVAPKNWTWS
jgi:hypothetical protein